MYFIFCMFRGDVTSCVYIGWIQIMYTMHVAPYINDNFNYGCSGTNMDIPLNLHRCKPAKQFHTKQITITGI